MIDFDEWFKNRHKKTGLYEEAMCGKDDATYIRHEMRKSYLVGQQSQQAKIDELQARIDEALQMLEYNEYTDSALQAIDILKGK